MKKVLTLVDFQNGFVAPNGNLTFDNGKGDIELIKRMLKFFIELKAGYFDLAIITYDTHYKENYYNTEEGKKFPLHCEYGTKDWNLAIDPNLVKSKMLKTIDLKKNTYDMWKEENQIPKDIIKDVNDVVIVGVASDICNKAALDGWLEKDVSSITIISDLTRGIFKETEEVLQEKKYEKYIETKRLKLITANEFLKGALK